MHFSTYKYCTLSSLHEEATAWSMNQGYLLAPDATFRCNRRTAVNAQEPVSPPSAGRDQRARP